MRNKLLRWVMSGVLGLIAAPLVTAQDTDLGSYQGPGISSLGIGSRSGLEVDLRYYLGVSGVADSTFEPFLTDSHGNLIRVPYLYGIEAGGGVYGVHKWKRSQLGLSYGGSYTRYLNNHAFDSSSHALALSYMDQVTQHLKLNFNESAGSLTYGTGQVANITSADLNSSFTPAVRLFDTRTYYLQSSASATYLQSARMSYTVGAGTFLQNLKSQGLSNSWGYNLDGSVMRRMSKSASVGISYEFSHFEFPGFSSQSSSHTFHGLYATGLGRFWTLSIEAGATVTQGESLFAYALNPVLAAILGQQTIVGISSFQVTYPSGSVALKRQFRRASLEVNYFRGVNSGNGAFTTGRLHNAYASFSYTGIRKLNLGAGGGYYNLKSISQNLGNFTQYTAGGGVSYSLGHDLHLSFRYDFRDQEVNVSNYRHNGSRATIGLNYSPGSLPLSLW